MRIGEAVRVVQGNEIIRSDNVMLETVFAIYPVDENGKITENQDCI